MSIFSGAPLVIQREELKAIRRPAGAVWPRRSLQAQFLRISFLYTTPKCSRESLPLSLITPSIGEAKKKLAAALHLYAVVRNKTPYLIGQFMDAEGAEHKQQGIYGISAWCVLTSQLQIDLSSTEFRAQIDPLTAKCFDWLKELVLESGIESLDPASDAFELRYVVSKICSVYEALAIRAELLDESHALIKRLIDCKLPHGWGFTTESTEANSISICIVLRTVALKGESFMATHINTLLDALANDAASVPNTFTKIYILNTIIRSSQAYKTAHETRAMNDLQLALSSILDTSSRLPLHPTSSINIDFYDQHRTRYYRLQPDLIALESLALMSNKNLIFLKTYPGDPLIRNLLETAKSSPLKIDTYGSRMSFSTCLDIYKCMDFIATHNETNVWLVYANVRAFFKFGFRTTEDVVYLLVGIVVGGIAVLTHWTFLYGTSAGIIITRLVAIVRNYFLFKQKKAGAL